MPRETRRLRLLPEVTKARGTGLLPFRYSPHRVTLPDRAEESPRLLLRLLSITILLILILLPALPTVDRGEASLCCHQDLFGTTTTITIIGHPDQP